MKLDFIDLGKLSVSSANMRSGRKAPDISDILPSIRARGILVPLLVRPGSEADSFEIVAGRRRFEAVRTITEEGATAEPVPCAIVEAGDDAAALEASIIENIARLDPDEVSRWECFVKLVREGRSPEDIGTTFGLPDAMVRRILALGNLLPRIRDLYRREAIDVTTVRHLTMASKQRQREWLALLDDEEARTPTGHALKAWLFGGASIQTPVALFDLTTYSGTIVADLFGEGGYFADADHFWEAQNAAIDERRRTFLEAGWGDVVIVPPTEHFHLWDHEKTPKRKGGRVYIDVRSSGEVTVHEGYVTRREASAQARGTALPGSARPPRPELTSAMQTYNDLHRQSAVRAALLGHPGVALRLMVAHAMAGSPLWTVRIEPQASRNEAIVESLELSPGEAMFDQRRRDGLALLALDPETPTLRQTDYDGDGLVSMFLRLLTLTDDDVMRILALVMGETLASGTPAIDAVGLTLNIAMGEWWEADPAFFDLIRDRETLLAILCDVAGEPVAHAHAKEKSKVIKQLISDHLEGRNGRPSVKGWVPRWMAFPPSAYTERGGVGSVNAHARIVAIQAAMMAQEEVAEPEAEAPALAA
jgi:ParB family chromosome partitioning protein